MVFIPGPSSDRSFIVSGMVTGKHCDDDFYYFTTLLKLIQASSKDKDMQESPGAKPASSERRRSLPLPNGSHQNA
jgi:hypothetical protein